MIVNIVDPDCIVLGGGASRIGAPYDRLPARIAAYAFTATFDTPVLPRLHGDASGVRGAAQLWPGKRPDPLAGARPIRTLLIQLD